ncbi:hypothetical protein FACS189499_04040 [Clostridia bacterium]|nr:hypothetical protein FACS189499_04040 [Clostridia bacterium]
MEKQISFGEYITKKRLERKITLRGFAAQLGLSPEYICNFEKGRKPAPKRDTLTKIVEVLNFDKEEAEFMYDIASFSMKTAGTIPGDLSRFIEDNKVVIAALRTAKDVDATDAEWREFMTKLNKRAAKGGGH